jgi:hypothetical protein
LPSGGTPAGNALFCGRELGRLQLRCHLPKAAYRRGVAALCRQRKPDVGLAEVLCYAATALMEDGEVELTVD